MAHLRLSSVKVQKHFRKTKDRTQTIQSFPPPLKIQILIFFKLNNSCKSKILFYKKYDDRKSAVYTKFPTFSIDFWLDKIRMKNF